MKFKAIITTRCGETINLNLSCSEYHANKLKYVFSRTLDRSIYTGVEIVAGFNSEAVEAAARLHIKKPFLVEKSAQQIEDEKKYIAELWDGLKNLKKAIEHCYNTGESSLKLEKRADVVFYKILELLKISVDDFEKELNEKNTRLYISKFPDNEKVKRIYVYFKDCYYRIIDKNMMNLLEEKIKLTGAI